MAKLSFFACMRGLILAMRIRIIFAAAVMIGPSLAYGSPACMTISEARAKFPNETLYSHQHCWNVSAALVFRALDFRALVFRAFGFRTVAAAPESSPGPKIVSGSYAGAQCQYPPCE